MEFSMQEIDFSHLTPDQVMAFCGIDQYLPDKWKEWDEIELSLGQATEFLTRPLLYLHECMALTTGLATDSRGGRSFLCPEGQGLPAAERLLADFHGGRLGFPLKREEFVRWAEDWLEYLPEATLAAFAGVGVRMNQGVEEIARERKNSREQALKLVALRLEEACCLLESQQVTLNRESLPGTKAPFVAYLRMLPEFADRSPDTVSDYLDDIPGYRWAGGRPNHRKIAHIFGCLGLRQSDIPG